jgi:hypothetical protein
MNTLLRICTVTIASFTLAACTPLGSTFTGATAYDDFWTVSRRQTYNLGDDFNRNSDLWVFASSLGAVESIPSKKVEISLITNPDSAAAPVVIHMLDHNSLDDTYRLTDDNAGTGRKVVVVTYGDKTAEYSIEVADPLGVGGGSGDDDGSGIGIIWK